MYEDSPTKGLCLTIASPMTSTFTLRSQLRLKLDNFLTCNISDNIYSYYIQTWHDDILIHGMHTHARFDDILVLVLMTLNTFERLVPLVAVNVEKAEMARC